MMLVTTTVLAFADAQALGGTPRRAAHQRAAELMVTARLLLLTACVAALACQRTPPAQQSLGRYARAPQDVCAQRPNDSMALGAVARDSAGIPIVENWVAEEPLDLARPPVTTIVAPDPSDAADLSGRVAAATRRFDGSIVIADSVTSTVAVFDSAGQFVRLLGRRGSGPGEYERIRGVTLLPGDTLVVIDLTFARRMTRVLFDGTFVDARLLPLAPILPDERPLSPHKVGHARVLVGVMSDGALLAYYRPGIPILPPGRGNGRFDDDSMVIQRIPIPGGEASTLGKVPQAVYFIFEDKEGSSWYWFAPFAPRGRIVVGRDGYHYGWGGRYEVRSYTPRGRLTRIVRVCLGPIHVNDQLAARYRDEVIARAEGNRQLTAEAHQATTFPNVGPAFTDLLADRAGWVWVGELALESDPQLWRVIDPLGKVVTAVEMLAGLRLVEVGSDHVLGIRTDADDLNTVIAYRWTAPTTGMLPR